MLRGFDGRTYNDDLLLRDEQRVAVRLAFPRCAHLLDHDALRNLFRQFDEPANAAKRRSRWAGLAAVGLAVVALFGASAAPLYAGLDPPWSRVIGGLSAVFGLSSAAIGLFGVIQGPSKKAWLCKRLITERLRQFHFQTFVCRLPAVLESLQGTHQRQVYAENRERWLAAFRLRFDNKLAAEFSSILQTEEYAGAWLHPPPPATFSAELVEQLPEEFFAAYCQLRIRPQLAFAALKLEPHQGLFSAFGLRGQQRLCSGGSLAATLALVATELLVAVQLISGIPVVVLPEVGHVFAVWCAIAALSLRTLQEGLQPKREIERYQRYRLATEDLLERFENAEDPAQKLDVMVEMERVSFREMCDFLRSNFESGFVM